MIAEEHLQEDDLRDLLATWVKCSRTVHERRNALMHSVYLEAGVEEPVTRLKASTRGGRWKAHSESLDLQGLEDFVQLIDQGIEMAKTLVNSLHTGSAVWPRKRST